MKLNQKLILIIPPCSNSSNTDKINFNKKNWFTFIETLSKNQQIFLVDFNLILFDLKKVKTGLNKPVNNYSIQI